MILNQTHKIHRQIINISRPEDGVFLPYFWIHMVLKSHWIPLHSINSHANWRMAATENMGQPPNRFRKNWRQISINYIIISYKIPINPPLVPVHSPAGVEDRRVGRGFGLPTKGTRHRVLQSTLVWWWKFCKWTNSGWWFQTFFIFHSIWDNPSHWLSYFARWLVKSPPTRINMMEVS